MTNSVTVTAPGGVAETNITNNTDDDVNQPASLTITKDDGFTVVAPGSVLTYTIDITNNGAVALTDLTVTDTLPAEVDFQSAVPTPTTNVGGVLTWNHAGLGLTGPFAPGATTSINLTIQVKDNVDIPSGVTSITNNITVSDSVTGTTDDDDDTDALARDNVKDLIASNHPPTIYPEVTIGEILTYRISLVVPAGVTMTNLRAVDVLETGLAFDECQTVSAPDLTSTRAGGIAGACPLGGSAANLDPAVTNSGHNITMDFGDVTNNHPTEDRTLSVDYWVVVLDTADNNNGVTGINNFVTWQWDGGSLTGEALPVDIVEPNMSILKDASQTVALIGRTITFTIDIEHTALSSTDAYDVVVTDQLPSGLEYVGNVTVTGLSYDRFNYDTVTSTITFEWDVFPLLATSTITFDATFVGPPPVVNEASVAWTSIPLDPGVQSEYNADSTERFYDPLDLTGVNDYGVSSSVTINRPALPKTGFAPGKITNLPAQPKEKEYRQIDSLTLEIPRLDVNLPVVGIPTYAQGWDLTWLSNQAGWLEGTAYPTLAGNTGITAHTYLADGTPGPFVDLGSLYYGDQVYIHANGHKYTYAVREVRLVYPQNLSVLRHEEYDWVTLITCREYNESTDDYNYRVVVRAVLVEVEPE